MATCLCDGRLGIGVHLSDLDGTQLKRPNEAHGLVTAQNVTILHCGKLARTYGCTSYGRPAAFNSYELASKCNPFKFVPAQIVTKKHLAKRAQILTEFSPH